MQHPNATLRIHYSNIIDLLAMSTSTYTISTVVAVVGVVVAVVVVEVVVVEQSQ
jgi:hypothetical protein